MCEMYFDPKEADMIIIQVVVNKKVAFPTSKTHSQHKPWAWTGGHFTEPNEQNTQQSPELGRRSALQFLHS